VFFVNKSKSKNQRNKRYYREKNQTNLAKKYTLNTKKQLYVSAYNLDVLTTTSMVLLSERLSIEMLCN
jgi:hypothetical protein